MNFFHFYTYRNYTYFLDVVITYFVIYICFITSPYRPRIHNLPIVLYFHPVFQTYSFFLPSRQRWFYLSSLLPGCCWFVVLEEKSFPSRDRYFMDLSLVKIYLTLHKSVYICQLSSVYNLFVLLVFPENTFSMETILSTLPLSFLLLVCGGFFTHPVFLLRPTIL